MADPLGVLFPDRILRQVSILYMELVHLQAVIHHHIRFEVIWISPDTEQARKQQE